MDFSLAEEMTPPPSLCKILVSVELVIRVKVQHLSTPPHTLYPLAHTYTNTHTHTLAMHIHMGWAMTTYLSLTEIPTPDTVIGSMVGMWDQSILKTDTWI